MAWTDWRSHLMALERHGRLLAIASAVLLALPSLTSPLLLDDVVHRAMLLDRLPGLHWGPLELYDFVGAPGRRVDVLRDSGSVPWFAADDLNLRFFRPLSSALLAGEAHLVSDRPWLARLHSLLWFLGCIAMAAAVHRRVLPPAWSALATLIYAVSAGHAMPVSWIAARYTLICTAFGLLSFWLHLRAREDGWKPGLWLSPLALLGGLLAGETALGAVALIVAWELFGHRDVVWRRLLRVAPVMALSVAYLTAYMLMDYGARGSGIYVDAAGGFGSLALVSRRFLILLAELVAATPSDAFAAGPGALETIGAVWGVLVVAGAAGIWRISRGHVPQHRRSSVRWLTAAAAAAVLPGTLASLGGRVLTIALVPASAIVAMLLVAGLSAAFSGRVRGARRLFVVVTAGGLAAGHLVVAPAVRVIVGLSLGRIAAETHTQAAHVPPCRSVMVIVAAADPAVATYVPATLLLWDQHPERLRVLSMAPADHRIERVTDTGFDLVTLDPGRSSSLWERLYRREPLRAGARVVVPSLDALVVEDVGGIPVRVRFDFGAPLDSPDLCFLQWRDGRLRPLRVPAHGTIYLPHEPGPMGW